jgi:hypothetical protein
MSALVGHAMLTRRQRVASRFAGISVGGLIGAGLAIFLLSDPLAIGSQEVLPVGVITSQPAAMRPHPFVKPQGYAIDIRSAPVGAWSLVPQFSPNHRLINRAYIKE